MVNLNLNLEQKLFGILIILIIYILFNLIILNNFKNHINGYWTATDEFLETSNLNEMIIYINDKCGYIIINECSIFLSNLFNLSFNLNELNFKVNIKEMNDEWKLVNNEKKYNVKISTVNNIMEIYSGDTIFAMLKRI
jgi:hypothetical protein